MATPKLPMSQQIGRGHRQRERECVRLTRSGPGSLGARAALDQYWQQVSRAAVNIDQSPHKSERCPSLET